MHSYNFAIALYLLNLSCQKKNKFMHPALGTLMVLIDYSEFECNLTDNIQRWHYSIYALRGHRLIAGECFQ